VLLAGKMTIRLLHLADLHLDRVFASAGCQGELARRRRQGLREALTGAGRLAVDQGCTAVTIGGDLYEHERAGVDTGRFLADTFASWQPMRVLIAPGNHDALLPGSLYRRVEWPSNVTVFGSTHFEPVELADGVTVWGLAHREPAWQSDPLAEAPATSASGVHLALFHGAELGSRPEGKSIHGPFHAERIRGAGFAAALCGHYHQRRLDSTSGLLYPGTPEPLGFDDEGGRGPVVVEVTGRGDVRFTAHDTNRWSVFTVECDADECGSVESVIDLVTMQCAATGYADPQRTMIRVDLRGAIDSSVSLDAYTVELAVRERLDLAAVKVRDGTTPFIDLDSALSEESTRGAFVRAATAAAADADVDDAEILEEALRYGLMALSGVEVGLR
jgi:exonuclease SbcD